MRRRASETRGREGDSRGGCRVCRIEGKEQEEEKVRTGFLESVLKYTHPTQYK